MPVYKEDIEECKRRVDAWWNHEIIDRAVLQVRAPRKASTTEASEVLKMDREAVEAWFLDPELVVPRLNRQLADTYFGGEAFPVMFPVAGRMVAITAAYLGCPLEFYNTDTVWAHPFLTDWDSRSPFRFNPDNKFWQKCVRLLR